MATEPKTYRVSPEVDGEIGRLAKIHGGVDKALRAKLGIGAAESAETRRERAAEAMASPPESPRATPPAPSARESSRERVMREKAERDAGARARSSIGDDPSFFVDPDFVQD